MAEWWQGSCTYLLGSFSPGRQRRARGNHLLDPVNERTEEMSLTSCQRHSLVSGAGSLQREGSACHRVLEVPCRDQHRRNREGSDQG